MSDIAKKNKNEVGFLDQAKGLAYDGFENVTDDLISLPFLKVAQPNSPELLPDSQVKGLKQGDLFNSVTGTVYGPSVQVILLGFDRSYLEWGEGNGQLLGRHSIEEVERMIADGDIEKDGPRLTKKLDGARVQETHTFFVMLPEYPDDGVLMLSFKSTGLKHVRKLLTKARAMRWTLPDGKVDSAPLYGIVWEIHTVLNKNDQGNWVLFGDAKTLSANRVGTLLEDKYKALQDKVLAAAGFVKDVQFKVNMSGARDVTESVPADTEM